MYRERLDGGEHLATQTEQNTMHVVLLPALASAIWIGGGSVSLILVIVVVVLLLR